MKKRRRIAFVGLVAVLLAIAAWFTFRLREPEYQGKRLSKDKLHTRFGELLDYLAGKGYQFVRVDELLEPNESP